MSRLSYANVVSTLALFLALGGTGYAATVLPRGSVGTAAIRDGAVRLRDLAPATRSRLQGRPSHRALVTRDGRLTGGDARAAERVGPGVYWVSFRRPVYRCAFAATLAVTSNESVGAAAAGRITVEARYPPTVAVVRTYDTAGTPADQPFHLVLAC